jgi:hypothetical protein
MFAGLLLVVLLVVVGEVVVRRLRRLAEQEHGRRQHAMNTQDLKQIGGFSAAPRPPTHMEQRSSELHRKRVDEREQRYVATKNRKAEHKQRSLEREERINQTFGK